MIPQLFKVADALGPVPWLLGGSGLLRAHGLAEIAHDWDVLVPASARPEVCARVKPWLLSLVTDRHPVWASAFIGRLNVEGAKVEVIGGMALRHAEGVYRVEVTSPAEWWEVAGRRVPLAPLEEWLLLYLLMGREEKAARIASALEKRPGAGAVLERLLATKQVPRAVQQQVARIVRPL